MWAVRECYELTETLKAWERLVRGLLRVYSGQKVGLRSTSLSGRMKFHHVLWLLAVSNDDIWSQQWNFESQMESESSLSIFRTWRWNCSADNIFYFQSLVGRQIRNERVVRMGWNVGQGRVWGEEAVEQRDKRVWKSEKWSRRTREEGEEGCWWYWWGKTLL